MTVLSDQQFADETNTWRDGYAGASRNVHTGQQAKVGEPGYMVSIPRHETVKPGKARTEDVTQHRKQMLADPVVQDDPEAHQGSWHVGPQGANPTKSESVTYDYSRRVLGRQFAVRLGRRQMQKAVFNLKTGDDVELPAGRMSRAIAHEKATASKSLDRVYTGVLLRGAK